MSPLCSLIAVNGQHTECGFPTNTALDLWILCAGSVSRSERKTCVNRILCQNIMFNLYFHFSFHIPFQSSSIFKQPHPFHSAITFAQPRLLSADINLLGF